MFEDFTATYDLYQAAIFRYCCWKSHDREIARDLTQETFLNFWMYLQSKKQIVHTRAFLYRIAHNLFITHVRKQREIASLETLLETRYEPSNDPWQQTCSRLDAERAINKLGKTHYSYNRVLHYRFVMGLAPAEAARITGETPNMIAVHTFRGLRYLRLLLGIAPLAPRPTLVFSPSLS